MIDRDANYEQLFDYFTSEGIDVSYPGFYDDEQFIRLERNNRYLLNAYASFIEQKTLDNTYLTHAENIIRIIAASLHKELKKDGRQGACVDLSMALSRILEKEGIWNYQVNGSLKIIFPKHANIKPKFFWSVDQGSFTAAHSWIVAPPYKIIDLAICAQPYKYNEEKFLPETILQKETTSSSFSLEDIVEPNILERLKFVHRNNIADIMHVISPNLFSFSKLFKPQTFTQKGIIFKYSPIGILAPDQPFENATSLKLNGLYGIEIYNRIVKPQLKN